MRAGLYARYSTEEQRSASITDQLRNAENLCGRFNWYVVKSYRDEAVSGAIRDRAGYQALLRDAEQHLFDIVVVDEISRLWRDQEEQWRAVKLLEYCGVHIVSVSDGIDTRLTGYQLLMSVRGAMNEEARREAARRTHRGLTGQAMKGYSAGGRSYGYRLVPIMNGEERTGVSREVILEEAEVVRRIFRRFAENASARTIAHELNRDRIPSPRGSTWALSGIYGDKRSGVGILNNPIYVGSVIWNRSRWVRDPKTNKRRRRERPKEEWVVQDIPALRIIDDSLWQKAQARISQRKRRFGRRPTYLLSGLLKCGQCGGRYVVVYRDHYGCSIHKDRGPSVCPNGLMVSRFLIERELLAGVKNQLLSDESVELYRKELARELKDNAKEDELKALKRRLDEVDAGIRRLVAAVKNYGHSEVLMKELMASETERDNLKTRLEEMNMAFSAPELVPAALDKYRGLINRLEAEVQDPEATEALKEILGEVLLKPVPEERKIEAQTACDLLKIASAGRMQTTLVAGVGFEPTTFGL